ncbi:MAG: hypothetical protein GY754_05350 [bacterium]|nr:hypothetical protein [bacterium]
MKKIFFAILILAVSTSMLFAGYSYTVSTFVLTSTTGSGSASGVISNARSSADVVQYIGCYGYRTATSYFCRCNARDSAGLTISGYSFDEYYFDLLKTINKDSHISFNVDDTGKLSFLFIRNMSYNVY